MLDEQYPWGSLGFLGFVIAVGASKDWSSCRYIGGFAC